MADLQWWAVAGKQKMPHKPRSGQPQLMTNPHTERNEVSLEDAKHRIQQCVRLHPSKLRCPNPKLRHGCRLWMLRGNFGHDTVNRLQRFGRLKSTPSQGHFFSA